MCVGPTETETDSRNKNDQAGLTDPSTSDERPGTPVLSDSTEVINMRLVYKTILTSTPLNVD